MKNQDTSDYKNYITVQDLFYPEYLQLSAPPAECDDNNSNNINSGNYNSNNINITPTVVAINEPDTTNGNGRHHRWGVVWAEATLLNDTKSSRMDGNNKSDAEAPEPSNGQNVDPVPPIIPSPDAVEMPTLAANSSNNTAAATSAANTNNNNNNNNNNHVVDAPYHHGNLIEVLVGLTFAFAAVALTLAFELPTMVAYVIATTMYTIAMKLFCDFNLSGILLFLYSLALANAPYACAVVFIVCSYALVLVDVTLFICSILIAELLAITAGILTSLFSCGNSGMIWHQYIRKICHLSRWAFRDIYPSIDKEPKRMFPIRNKQNSVNETTANNNATTADPTIPVPK